jgi:hypothetical protein
MRALVLLVLACTGCWTDSPHECFGDFLVERRDPDTGICIELGDADACKFCAVRPSKCTVATMVAVARLDDPTCAGTCILNFERECLDAPGCRAIYTSAGFFGCWSTAPSGPVGDGACAGLGAYECSRHDNCAAWYVKGDAGYETKSFDHCADEVPAKA